MHHCVPVAEVGYQDIPITFTRKAMQCADSTPGPKADRFPKSTGVMRRWAAVYTWGILFSDRYYGGFDTKSLATRGDTIQWCIQS